MENERRASRGRIPASAQVEDLPAAGGGRYLRAAPLTIAFMFLVVLAVLLAARPEFSPGLWALFAGGEFSYAGTTADFPYGAFLEALVVCLLLFLLARWMYDPVEARYPLPGDCMSPRARGIDVAVNRYGGLLLLLLGAYLLLAPSLSTVLSGVFACSCLGAGAFLAARPGEAKAAYTLSAPSKLSLGTDPDVEGDPLFRAWVRSVKARFERERRGAAGASSASGGPRDAGGPGRGRGSRGTSGKSSGMGASWKVDDPWSVLGIEPGTPMKKITRKWRRLCKRYHPDVVPTGLKEETEEALKKINAAYRLIKEQNKKAAESCRRE